MKRAAAFAAAALVVVLARHANACIPVPFEDAESDLRAEATRLDRELYGEATFVGVVQATRIEPAPNIYAILGRVSGLNDPTLYDPGYGKPVKIEFKTVEALKGDLRQFNQYGVLLQTNQFMGPPPPPGMHVQQYNWIDGVRYQAKSRGSFTEPGQVYQWLDTVDLRDFQGEAACQQPLFVTGDQKDLYLVFLGSNGHLLKGGAGRYELLTGPDDPWLSRVKQTARSQLLDQQSDERQRAAVEAMLREPDHRHLREPDDRHFRRQVTVALLILIGLIAAMALRRRFRASGG